MKSGQMRATAVLGGVHPLVAVFLINAHGPFDLCCLAPTEQSRTDALQKSQMVRLAYWGTGKLKQSRDLPLCPAGVTPEAGSVGCAGERPLLWASCRTWR